MGSLFIKIREKLSGFVGRLAEAVKTKEIGEKELSPVLEELKLGLIESDVAYEVAESLCESLRKSLIGRRVERAADIRDVVRRAISDVLDTSVPHPPDLLGMIKRKCGGGEPFVVMVMGVNGTGKTTSIAKLASYLRNEGISVLLVAADTFRAGAQEQLAKHAERLNIPVIRARYGVDPAAVAYDAVQHARKRRHCAVIVDTAGRMHTDSDLMAELRKIARVIKPDFRLLVVDSLTGNDAVEQAKTFNELVGVDGFFLTKVDADAKGGASVSVSMVTGKPIVFLGTGQTYADIVPFTKRWLIERIVGEL